MTKNNSKRYYLHQKVKPYGVVVHPKQRTIELDDKLFRYPSALLSTYIFKLIKLNYSIQSVIMTAKKAEIAKVSFVKPEELAEKFKYANSRMEILNKTSLELKVESSEQLVIAENNSKETHNLIKEVEKVRKMIKEPYASTVTMIDSYCKTISDNLERIKTRFVSEITAFKTIEEARLKAESESKLNDLKILESEKKEESEKITRIENQLIARIYGGQYTTKDGQPKSAAGCIKSSECDDLLKWINDNAPAITVFKHFPTLYEDMLISIKSKLAGHKINLIELETKNDSPIAREGAMRRIAESRIEAIQEVQTNAATFEKVIEKSVKKEVRTINNEIEAAGKGIRETLTFEVVDELLVPRDMLSVDPTKINDYLNANKDKIKESLTKGEESIPGIRFFVDNKFITR